MSPGTYNFSDMKALKRVINNAEICRIGMVDHGQPYVIPICFGYDGKDIYIHSSPEGKKENILLNNPKVCLEFEEEKQLVPDKQPCDWTYSYSTVLGFGSASLVKGRREKIYGLEQIAKHYKGRLSNTSSDTSLDNLDLESHKQSNNYSRGLAKEAVDAAIVFKIVLTELTGKTNTP